MSEHRDQRVQMVHGDGGRATGDLIERIFLPSLGNDILSSLDDAAALPRPRTEEGLAISTDSFVVSPPEFPGGDIGRLAVCGTANDLAVSGARPRQLCAGFILEEGFGLDALERIVRSMAGAMREVGLTAVAADTKVVGRGQGDGIYINTTGVGTMHGGTNLGLRRVRPDDVLLVTGCVGDHGVAILAHREGLEFSTPVRSDCGSVWPLVRRLLDALGDRVKFMRDPTRGGLATTLNEIALGSGRHLRIDEARIPVREEVRAAAEMFGLDPLYLANEGKLVAVVEGGAAEEAVSLLQDEPMGRDAAVIGEVRTGRGALDMRTPFGGTVRLGMREGDPLPRIC